MMFGQMTAGSWIYIGSQGIVQGTYETFVEMGRQHFGGNLAGKWILTAGLGGMGGAQPLAATMAGASMLAIECRPEPHRQAPAHALPRRRRPRPRRGAGASSSTRSAAASRYPLACSAMRRDPAGDAQARRQAGCRHRSDFRARSGERLPAATAGRSRSGTAARRGSRTGSPRAARKSMARARRSDARLPEAGHCRCSTTATTSARSRSMKASRTPSHFPGFVPAYIRPLFCRGRRAVSLGGALR